MARKVRAKGMLKMKTTGSGGRNDDRERGKIPEFWMRGLQIPDVRNDPENDNKEIVRVPECLT